MRNKGRIVLLTTCCVWMWLASVAGAQVGEYRPGESLKSMQRESLRGLEGIALTILVDSDTYLEGMSAGKLQTDVELRLRRSGVRVLTGNEIAQTPGNPVLNLNVSILKSTLLYVYSISVQLTQQVGLKRNPAVEISANTWQTSLVAFVTTIGDPSPKISESVDYLIDKFINDYLAMNPK